MKTRSILFGISGLVLSLAPVQGQLHHWRADRSWADERGDLTGTLEGGQGYADGVAGSAFNFDGADDMVRFNGTPLAPPWSLALWVWRQDSGDASAVLFRDTATAIKLEQWPSTRKVGFTRIGVADYVFDYVAPTGRWTHLVLTAGPGVTALYANGQLVGTRPETVNLPRAYLGAPAGNRLKGRVDEIKIWNRVLTTNEVRAEAIPRKTRATRWRGSLPCGWRKTPSPPPTERGAASARSCFHP